MRSIGVSEYGPPENLHSKEVPKPGKPTGHQLLVQVKGGKSSQESRHLEETGR